MRFGLQNLPAFAWSVMAVMSQIASAAEDPAGEKIYREKCAICHGAAGEGTTDEYPHFLSGDKPVAELANLIDKSMPKDAPEDCVGEDAEKVAAYLYDAFYSPIAQARIKPARMNFRDSRCGSIAMPWLTWSAAFDLSANSMNSAGCAASISILVESATTSGSSTGSIPR